MVEPSMLNEIARKNLLWKIRDIIDLETFQSEDRFQKEEILNARDRQIFLDVIKPLFQTSKALDSRQKIRLWLETRRQKCPATPGSIFQQAYHFFSLLMVVLGLFFGVTVAASHLYYYGDRPINVLVFFFITVVLQMLLLSTLACCYSFRNTLEIHDTFSLFQWLINDLFFRFAKIKESALDSMDGASRLNLKAICGRIQMNRSIYGSIMLWPLLMLVQIFAISYNFSLVATLLFLVTVTNRAFGWESTLNFSGEMLFQIVKAISLPWSWFAANAHPTLEQVLGSRIAVIGQGVYSVDVRKSYKTFQLILLQCPYLFSFSWLG